MVDREYEKLLEEIRDRRKVGLWIGHDDRERLLIAVQRYRDHMHARGSEQEVTAFEGLAEEIRGWSKSLIVNRSQSGSGDSDGGSCCAIRGDLEGIKVYHKVRKIREIRTLQTQLH